MVATPKFRALAAVIFTTAGLLIASHASGQVPDAGNSSMPSGLQLVGSAGGIVDPAGKAMMTIRDAAGIPVPIGTPVTIDFFNCTINPNNDLHVCMNQTFPGVSLVGACPANPVFGAITGPFGVVEFRLLGHATAGPGNTPGVTAGCAVVRAGVPPVIMTVLRVGAYNLDGVGGVTAADQALFLATFFSSPAGYRTRADYNGDGLCNSADFSKFLSVEFSGASAVKCAPPNCF